VDGEELFRVGIAQVLRSLGERVEVAEADSLVGALEQLVRQPFVDLVLADWRLPDVGGEPGLARLVLGAGAVPVLAVSPWTSGADARRVLAAGARGLLPRGSSPALLLAAVRLVLAGGAYLPIELLDEPEAGGPARAPAAAAGGGDGALTDRQRQILALVTEGRSNKEIARALGLAEGTVKIHLTRVFRALGVRSRAQAIVLTAGAGGCLAARGRAA
jgi:DNA-binding NarL/FixJ family response regulator